jgi:hypothetical protein
MQTEKAAQKHLDASAVIDGSMTQGEQAVLALTRVLKSLYHDFAAQAAHVEGLAKDPSAKATLAKEQERLRDMAKKKIPIFSSVSETVERLRRNQRNHG